MEFQDQWASDQARHEADVSRNPFLFVSLGAVFASHDSSPTDTASVL
jgi:hypothetical protein